MRTKKNKKVSSECKSEEHKRRSISSSLHLGCLYKSFKPKTRFGSSKSSRSRSHSKESVLVSNIKEITMMKTDSLAARAQSMKLMESMTMVLNVSPKDVEKVVFSMSLHNSKESEHREVKMTNKELLKMMNTGKQFQPTTISKESRETINGLWMQVFSETGTEEKLKMNESQIQGTQDDSSLSLLYTKRAALFPTAILAVSVITLFLKDDIFLHDMFLNSSNSIVYLKITIWCSFAAFVVVLMTIHEIRTLQSKLAHNATPVELKVVVEQWSSGKLQSDPSSTVSDITSSHYGKESDVVMKSRSLGTMHQKSNQISKEKDTLSTSKSISNDTGNSTDPEGLGIDYPIRYLRAAKGDPIHGRERYESTMAWRKQERMDTILDEPFIYFQMVKKYYPHFYHLRGKNNEPVYYESPAKTDLKKLKKAGMKMDDLLRYYALVTEYMWKRIEPSEEGKSIYVIDLDGIRVMDFVGDVIDFVKKTSSFTAAHYPERSGTIFVINVPSWFNIIWKVVSPMADEVTRRKIRILRGKENILNDLLTRIDMDNIPCDYGGQSMPLGQSPEEIMFAADMMENLRRANLSPVQDS